MIAVVMFASAAIAGVTLSAAIATAIAVFVLRRCTTPGRRRRGRSATLMRVHHVSIVRPCSRTAATGISAGGIPWGSLLPAARMAAAVPVALVTTGWAVATRSAAVWSVVIGSASGLGARSEIIGTAFMSIMHAVLAPIVLVA